MKRNIYIAPKTQEHKIETIGVLMSSPWGPPGMPATPITNP